MKEIKLSPRLQAVASYITPNSTLADIGTDHGLLPVYCLQTGLCRALIASDIAEGPLASAKKTAREQDCLDRISFVCSPGLDGIEPGSVDTITIAGMGGETIQHIMQNAPWLKGEQVHVILQPQSKLPELQNWLWQEGYRVERACLVKEGKRLYLILSVYYCGTATEKDRPYWLNHLTGDSLRGEFVTLQLERLQKEIHGLEISGKNPQVLNALLPIVEELRRYL